MMLTKVLGRYEQTQDDLSLWTCKVYFSNGESLNCDGLSEVELPFTGLGNRPALLSVATFSPVGGPRRRIGMLEVGLFCVRDRVVRLRQLKVQDSYDDLVAPLSNHGYEDQSLQMVTLLLEAILPAYPRVCAENAREETAGSENDLFSRQLKALCEAALYARSPVAAAAAAG